MVANLSYEECRRKRVEENQKRMESLNLHKLSKDLHVNSSPKPSPLKQVRNRTIEKELVVVRRSTRVANQPSAVYKEVVVERVMIPRRVCTKHRDLSNRVYASDKAREKAMMKALNLESSLAGGYPSFVKSMLQSHVTGGFWLGLPSHFCRRHLPKRDEVMKLIDEDGGEHDTIYLHRKTGLSGGWKGFAVAHQLADGDSVVFQSIKPTTFKVYIVRVNELEDDQGNNAKSSLNTLGAGA